MARYQSFAALGTILEASLQKKRADIDKAFKALDISMQSDLLKEKIAQQSWENEMKVKEFNLNAEARREDLKTQKLNRTIALENMKLKKWQQTKEKLDMLEGESLDLNLEGVDKFHASLGTSFQEGDTWLEDMEETLEDNFDLSEGYRNRLLDSSMKASKGNSLPTTLLIEELDQAVKQYNIAQTAPADQKQQAQYLISDQQRELVRFYLQTGTLELQANGTVKATARYQNIFSSSLVSSANLRKIDLEQNQLLMEDDTDIQSDIDIAEYQTLESELRQLDLLQASNQIKEARENIEKQRMAKDLGISVDEVDLQQSIDEVELARDAIESAEDKIELDRRKIQSLTTTESLLNIDAESQIKELSKSIADSQAEIQALTVTRDKAEYDRDIDYALYHLKKVSKPDRDTYPEHGYSSEQIDKMLEYLESVIASGKSGRVMNKRELMEAGRYVGI